MLLQQLFPSTAIPTLTAHQPSPSNSNCTADPTRPRCTSLVEGRLHHAGHAGEEGGGGLSCGGEGGGVARRHQLAHYCDNRAMQYYRLWIYTCNGLLLVCVLGFAVVAVHTVLTDERRHLVPGLELLQPTFVYGYLAVLTQSGLIQLIGCVGARRLNQKLLNVYWLILLLLVFGDAMVGVVWMFRFDHICGQLRPWLKQRLASEYGIDADFTAAVDAFQRHHNCCGAESALDFINRTSTGSTGGPEGAEATGGGGGGDSAAASGSGNPADLWTASSRASPVLLPESCCQLSAVAPPPTVTATATVAAAVTAVAAAAAAALPPPPPPNAAALRNYHHHSTTTSTSTVATTVEDAVHIIYPSVDGDGQRGAAPGIEVEMTCGGGVGGGGGGARIVGVGSWTERRHFTAGCEDKLLQWLRHTADVLFILGYCVCGFLKLCFLGILRYEIKEMIQKIRVLQGELSTPQILAPEPILTDPGRKSPPGQRFHNNNGSVVTGCAAAAHAELGAIPGAGAAASISGGDRDRDRDRGDADADAAANDGGGDSPVLGSGASRTPQDRRHRADSSAGTTPLLLHAGESVQTTPLLHHQQSTAHQRHHQRHYHHHYLHHHHLSLGDGNDSDTNSHCALLINDDASNPQAAASGVAGGASSASVPSGSGSGTKTVERHGSNGNNNYEVHEMDDLSRLLVGHRSNI